MTVYHGAIVTINANDDVFQYLVEHKGPHRLCGRYAAMKRRAWLDE